MTAYNILAQMRVMRFGSDAPPSAFRVCAADYAECVKEFMTLSVVPAPEPLRYAEWPIQIDDSVPVGTVRCERRV